MKTEGRCIKVLCYLRSEKIGVVVLQNEYMFAKNYHLHWIEGRANILSKYLIYVFSILCVAFAVAFFRYFQKLHLFVVKKIELIFAALYFYISELKKCISDF